MCDYSLEAIASRKAQVGDRLSVVTFDGTFTRGFASDNDQECAVCLEPGAELAFDAEIEDTYFKPPGVSFGKVARVREVDTDNPYTHHDAIETANGHILKMANLTLGQTCTVLQLGLDEPVPESAVPADTALVG